MTLQKALAATALVLAVVLGIQITGWVNQPHTVQYFASWINLANSLDEAVELADQVVVAQVAEVERGPDLVSTVPEEPDGGDRIPVEVVTLKVARTLLGPETDIVRLFHTMAINEAVFENPAPRDDDEKDTTPDGPPEPTNTDQRTNFLDGDPPYEVGEIYVLFLQPGPTLGRTETQAVFAPEGRYRVDSEGRLEPVTERGFAPKMAGMPLEALEEALLKQPVFDPTPITIEQALDTNGNDHLDDAEMVEAIRLWVTGVVVPGTDQTIDDAKMRELVQLWIQGQSLSGQRASTPVAQNIQPLQVRGVSLVPSSGGHTLNVAGAGIASVTLQVFDLSGRRLFEKTGSSSRLRFDAVNVDGRRLANGVYLYLVQVQGTDGQTWRSTVNKFVVLN